MAVADVPDTGQIVGAAWSPPSGQIAFSVWRGGMYQVPAGGGAPALLFDIDPERQIDFHYPSWLANGDLRVPRGRRTLTVSSPAGARPGPSSGSHP